VAAEVEVGADGSFVIPVRRLPDASFAVGDTSARIAWGSVVVAADANGNGLFDLLVASDPFSGPDTLADLAVAASFVTLQGPQQRLAFREGGWD
jgi:hypothetical protein